MANILDEFIKNQNREGGPGANTNAVRENTATGDILNYAQPTAPADRTDFSAGIIDAPDVASEQNDLRFLPGGEAASQQDPYGDRFTGAGLQNALRPGRRALRAAQVYHDHVSEDAKTAQAAQTTLDTADAIHKTATLDPTDPEFATHLANIVASHPHLDEKRFNLILAPKLAAGNRFHASLAKGGAAEFGSIDNPTPAFQAYKDTLFTSKGDHNAARATALNVAKSEALIGAAQDKGLFTNADRLNSLNPDGKTLNYAAAEKIIHQRTGAGEGLKSAEATLKEHTANVRTILPQLTRELKRNDPGAFKQLHGIYQNSLNFLTQHGQNVNDGETAVAPSSAPASSFTTFK